MREQYLTLIRERLPHWYDQARIEDLEMLIEWLSRACYNPKKESTVEACRGFLAACNYKNKKWTIAQDTLS